MSACATQKPGEAFIKKDDRVIGLDAGSCKKVKKDGASSQDAELACSFGGHHGFKSKEKIAADVRAHRTEIESRIQRACGKSGGKYDGTVCVLPAKDGLSVQRITVTSEDPKGIFFDSHPVSYLFRPIQWCGNIPYEQRLRYFPVCFPIIIATLPLAIVAGPLVIVTVPLMPILGYENHTISITTRDDTQTYLAEQQRQRETQARREAEEAERRQREFEEQARWEADRPRREAEERARLKAEEAEEQRRQEAEARARREEEARLARFRKGLKTGDDTFCGPVIETRDNNKMIRISVRVKLQGYATSDEWLKAEEVYPPNYGCRNVNGRLSPY